MTLKCKVQQKSVIELSAWVWASFLLLLNQRQDTWHHDIYPNDTHHKRLNCVTLRATFLQLCCVSLCWVLWQEQHFYCYAECHYAECHYVESRGASAARFPWPNSHLDVIQL